MPTPSTSSSPGPAKRADPKCTSIPRARIRSGSSWTATRARAARTLSITARKTRGYLERRKSEPRGGPDVFSRRERPRAWLSMGHTLSRGSRLRAGSFLRVRPSRPGRHLQMRRRVQRFLRRRQSDRTPLKGIGLSLFIRWVQATQPSPSDNPPNPMTPPEVPPLPNSASMGAISMTSSTAYN